MPVAKVEKPTKEALPSDPKARQLSLTGKGKDYNFRTYTQCDLSSCTKRQIKEYFKNTYDLDELLFSAVQDVRYLYKCPDRLRLPLIFYLPHPSSVYINKMMLSGIIEERVNGHFEKLFETGVDEMSWDDTENYRMGGSFKWPELHEVIGYRNKVRQVVNDAIDNTPLQLPVTQDSPWWSVFMGMEHERIHIETSSVLIRQLPVEAVKKPDNWTYAPPMTDTPPGPNKFVTVPAGKAVVGKPRDFPSYGWDNEYGNYTAEVPEFEASQYLVTNEEFLEFVNDGGYHRRELWTDEGWKWREFRQARHPTFWVCEEGCKSGCGADLATYSHCKGPATNGHSDGASNGHSDGASNGHSDGASNGHSDGASNGATNGHSDGASNGHSDGASNGHSNGATNGHSDGASNGHSNGATNRQSSKYRYRAMFDMIEMPWYWPVDANYHEAKAFCTWKGPDYRLPTEAEHHRMRGEEAPTSDVSCDPTYDSNFPANFNLKYGSSTPVNMFPPTPMGFYDVFGNVWEWTEDHFNGLPGFKTSYLYDDFSSPCFDGRHTLMMGGSWISTGNEASRFARFAFRRHFFQHLGFRLARSSSCASVRLCDVEVFVLGAGVSDNPVTTLGVDLEKAVTVSTNHQFLYETEEKLKTQLQVEYGLGNTVDVNYVEFVDSVVKEQGAGRSHVIQFGCGTGYSAFLLTKVFDKVTAVDYSGRFLDTAIKIQSGESVPYGNGTLAVVPEGTKPKNVVFMQLTWVPNEVEDFDVVVFEFIDRLCEPKGWLLKLWETVVKEGVVIFLTAADSQWDEAKIRGIIGKWFALKQKCSLGQRVASVWKRKP